MILWARDGWWATDKLEHFTGSFLLFGWLLAAGLSPAAAAFGFLVAAIGVELVEWWRFARWTARGKPSPWPYLCDEPSYRDLAWDAAGAAASALILLVLR